MATRSATKVEQQTILVVEDDRDLLEVLGMLLDFERYRFVLVKDGQQAVEWLAEHRPALVSLDWRLPKLGGAEVVRAVRARYGTQVPILVVSALADTEDARAAGADGYLRKPYVVEDLVEAIRRLIQPKGTVSPHADDNAARSAANAT